LISCAGPGEVRLVDTSDSKPDFVSHVPKGHFVGYSSGNKTVSRAKRLALRDVMIQISRSIGYELHLETEIKTVVDGDIVQRSIKEYERSFCSAILNEVEPNIKQIHFEKYRKEGKHGVDYYYDTFILVHFPNLKIRSLRKLAEKENQKRLLALKQLISAGENAETLGDFTGAVVAYHNADRVCRTLLKDRMFYESIAKPKFEALLGSLNIIKVDENRFGVKVRVTFKDNKPVNDLPLFMILKKGRGKVPKVIFTNKNGYAEIDVSKTASNIKNNTVMIKPKLTSGITDIKFEINFSTIIKKPMIYASRIDVNSFKVSGILKKHLEKASFTINLSERNGVKVVFDRYRLEAIAYYPVFMKDDFETEIRQTESTFKRQIILEGNSRKVAINLDRQTCKQFSELMTERKPAKIRFEVVLLDGNGNDLARTSTNCLKI
jgi:hypothetical protein